MANDNCIGLSNGEIRVLRSLRELKREADVSEIASISGLSVNSVMSYIEALSQKGLINVKVEEKACVELTEEGKRYAIDGLPERKLLNIIALRGGKIPLRQLQSMAGMTSEEMTLALGWLRRKGWGSIETINGERYVIAREVVSESAIEAFLKKLLSKGNVDINEVPREVLSELKTRKLITISTIKMWRASITDEGVKALERAMQIKTVGALTADLIRSGEWRSIYLKPYDVKAEPPVVYPARKHFYMEFLDRVRRILLEMGFVEAEGPYVELEFWNFDVLFQAQDHPAREIHDCFVLAEPSRGCLPERDLVEKVKKIHEEKWHIKWSEEQASRLILRSHTTAVSARFLAKKPKPPVKMFCISKVFRPDVIDSTHFIEFTQVEGIYGDRDVNLRMLLGILQDFVKRLGFKEVRFRPSYFPFTEPSVEGSVYHPELGWIECLGAGMFRPEVLESLGIDYPVAAWGIGIDRLAMVTLGISDIRELCSHDLRFLRSKVVTL